MDCIYSPKRMEFYAVRRGKRLANSSPTINHLAMEASYQLCISILPKSCRAIVRGERYPEKDQPCNSPRQTCTSMYTIELSSHRYIRQQKLSQILKTRTKASQDQITTGSEAWKVPSHPKQFVKAKVGYDSVTTRFWPVLTWSWNYP